MAGDTEVDADLIQAVRAGDLLAYDRLFRRHLPAARRVASMVWRDRAEVDDLVAESFLRVLVAIRDGAGPAERFRPYLLVTLRNLAMDWGRRRERSDPWAAAREEGAPGVEEIVVDRLTGEVALSAFRTLPPRWRYVLWHTEMLGTGPGKLAGELGMTANGVAALAVRAREGLRQAFLQAHVPAAGAAECRTVRRRLGAWTRGKVTPRQRRAVSAHLAGCSACRRVAALLDTVNGGLPALALVPLVSRLLGGTGASAASVATGGGVAVLSKMAAGVTLAAVAVAGPTVAPHSAEPAGSAPQAVAADAVSSEPTEVPVWWTPSAPAEDRTPGNEDRRLGEQRSAEARENRGKAPAGPAETAPVKGHAEPAKNPSDKAEAEPPRPPKPLAAEKPPKAVVAGKAPESAAAGKAPKSGAAEKGPESGAVGKRPESGADRAPKSAAAEKPLKSAAAGKTPEPAAAEKEPKSRAAGKAPEPAAAEKPPKPAAAGKAPKAAEAEKGPKSAAVGKPLNPPNPTPEKAQSSPRR